MKRWPWLVWLLVALPAFAQVYTNPPPAIIVSGGTVSIQNPYLGMNGSFEEVVSGAPATVSITVQGCMRGTAGTPTCDTAADTNTTVGDTIRFLAATKVYTSFLVTASWTGGTNVSVQVNPAITTARNGNGSSGSITGVTAGTGLSGGGTSGNVTVTNAGVVSMATSTTNTVGLTVTPSATTGSNIKEEVTGASPSFGTSVSAPVVNATTGFQIGGAAAIGHSLVGNGTDYVDAVPVSGTTGYLSIFTSSTAVGNSLIDEGQTTTNVATIGDTAGLAVPNGPISSGSAPPAGAGVTGAFPCAEASTGVTAAAGADFIRCDSTAHGFKLSLNGGAEFISAMNFPRTTVTHEIAIGFSNGVSVLAGATSCGVITYTGTVTGLNWISDVSGSATIDIQTESLATYASNSGGASGSSAIGGPYSQSSAFYYKNSSFTTACSSSPCVLTGTPAAPLVVCAVLTSPSTIHSLSGKLTLTGTT